MKLLKILVVVALPVATALGQYDKYSHLRPVDTNGAEGWHAVILPADIFSRVDDNLADIRLLHVTASDTVELPFLVRKRTFAIKTEVLNIASVTESRRDERLFLTFAIPEGSLANRLTLAFSNDNYIGKVTAEGSDDRVDWFELMRDQPIVSVNRGTNRVRLNDVALPTSHYRWLRIGISSDEQLESPRVSLERIDTTAGTYDDIPTKWIVSEDRKAKQTVVHLAADYYRPVSHLSFSIEHNMDYYREFELSYAYDSMQTAKGWIRNYTTTARGYLTSFRKNELAFEPVNAKHLRLKIFNSDSPPVSVVAVSAKGPQVELVANLPHENVYLYYGNANARPPSYDLHWFDDKVPSDPPAATLGLEQSLVVADVTKPPGDRRIWLWVVLAVGIGVLGFFTWRMMSTHPETT